MSKPTCPNGHEVSPTFILRHATAGKKYAVAECPRCPALVSMPLDDCQETT